LSRRIEACWCALLALAPAAARAQRAALELHVGRWYGDNRATTYEFRTSAPLGPVLDHGFTAMALVNDSLGRRRAFYGAGYEITAFRGRATIAPYGVLGAAVGLSTDTTTQQLAVLWSLGGGVEWRPFPALALGVEARYQLDDRGPRGFWRPAADARDGLSATVGVAIGLGGGGRRTPHVSYAPPATVTGDAAAVVETAIAALGTPYQWGGTAENGFDCSGLIQYAYGQHGIRLPRRSRDQASAGAEVTPVVGALRPGDILLFAARPGYGVTHVGMYVGEGKFIHSGSHGVKISLLDPHDPDGAYWMDRWVGARRVIP
jgi:cell wall-associated NlpC family hydrolase